MANLGRVLPSDLLRNQVGALQDSESAGARQWRLLPALLVARSSTATTPRPSATLIWSPPAPGFTATLVRIASNGVQTSLVETTNRFACDLILLETGPACSRVGVELIAADKPDAFLDNTPTATLTRRSSAVGGRTNYIGHPRNSRVSQL